MTECQKAHTYFLIQKAHTDFLIFVERVIANTNADSEEIALVDTSLIAAMHRDYERYLNAPPMPMVD